MSTSTRRRSPKQRDQRPGLWDLRVAVTTQAGAYGGHAEVTVLPALCDDLEDLTFPWPWTLAETRAAWRWMHGLACRLVYMRSGALDDMRREHQRQLEGGGIACECGVILARPNLEFWPDDIANTQPGADARPWPTFVVPPAEAKRWAAMLRDDLAVLLADAAKTTTTVDEEAEWLSQLDQMQRRREVSS